MCPPIPTPALLYRGTPFPSTQRERERGREREGERERGREREREGERERDSVVFWRLNSRDCVCVWGGGSSSGITGTDVRAFGQKKEREGER